MARVVVEDGVVSGGSLRVSGTVDLVPVTIVVPASILAGRTAAQRKRLVAQLLADRASETAEAAVSLASTEDV